MLHRSKSDSPVTESVKDPTSFELAILHGLQSKPVWQGGHKQPRAKARAANKVARHARRANRKGR